jgi:CspA family cold shock protein
LPKGFDVQLIPLPLDYYINYLFYTTMSTGTVKFFNESKGFGFIIEDDSKQEHFVHVTGLVDEIREGDNVEFELKEGRKGLNAVNVKVL